jgi:hypothetical protein
MGLTVLDPHGFIFAPVVKGIDRYTYWLMPAHAFMQVAWYKLFGFGLFALRSMSIAWAAAAVACWFFIVSRLTRSRMTGLIAALLLAADQRFVLAAATGRFDVMCLALDLGSVVAYLLLRRRFWLAIIAGSTLLSLAFMTHPNGIFGVILFVAVMWQDRRRIEWSTPFLAAAPFAIVFLLWGLYILKAPDVFLAQVQVQSATPHRFFFDWNLIRHFREEFLQRFAYSYGLVSLSVRPILIGSPALLYFVAVATLAVVAEVRNRPGAKFILILATVDFTLLSCLEKHWIYLVYILPAFSAAIAVVVTWLWQKGPAARAITGVALAAILFLNFGVNAFRIIHNEKRFRYAKVIDYLTTHVPSNELIMGSAELVFGLGFDRPFVDDCRLGFGSGRIADYIVLETQYSYWFAYLAAHEQATYNYVRKTLDNDYEKVYDQAGDPYHSIGSWDQPYQVYKLKTSKEIMQSRRGGRAAVDVSTAQAR